MNVHLVPNWSKNGYDVTFFLRDPALRVMRLGDHDTRAIWEEVDPNVTVEPTFTLETEALEALLAEAEKVIPASHATERHLKDVVDVRDRLLALVEKRWNYDEDPR